MGGGLPKGTIVTITGTDGAGKSAIIQRFIYGLIRHNYRLTVVSTELTTKGFIDQCTLNPAAFSRSKSDLPLVFLFLLVESGITSSPEYPLFCSSVTIFGVSELFKYTSSNMAMRDP